jgi:hypothetical protein
MYKFIHNENLALFKKKLADPQTTDTERKVVQKLLAEEEAREPSAETRRRRTRVSRLAP